MRPSPCRLRGGTRRAAGPARRVPFSRSTVVLAIQTGMGWVARLVPGIGRFARAVATGEFDHEVAIVNELIARIVSHRVHARVHADRVARTSLDAIAAKHAAELVDDEHFGKTLV